MTHRGPFQPLPFCDSVMRTALRKPITDTKLGFIINGEASCVMQKERAYSEAESDWHGMKFSATGLGVTHLGTRKIIYSVGAHHLETVVEKTLGVFAGSTKAACNVYDVSKKQKDIGGFKR